MFNKYYNLSLVFYKGIILTGKVILGVGVDEMKHMNFKGSNSSIMDGIGSYLEEKSNDISMSCNESWRELYVLNT